MVTVRKQQPEKADGSVDIEQWLARLPVDAGFDTQLLKTACEVSYAAEQKAIAISDKAWDESSSSVLVWRWLKFSLTCTWINPR